MTESISLQRRLFLATFSLVLASLALAGIASYFFNERLESMVLSVFMDQEMAVVRSHIEDGTLKRLPRISSLETFVGDDDVPEEVHSLPLGHHHDVRIGGNRYEVMIDEAGGQRIWLMFEINRIERLAGMLFLLLGVMLVSLTALAGWVSLRLAHGLASPIDRLADRVDNLSPKDFGTRLEADFRGEEVERIARAFDRYLERIEGFVEREQAFTAAASHELRTPLSVIQGATEILDAGLHDERLRKALFRVQRARREMSEFISALLSMAREEAGVGEFRAESHVDDICRHICEDMQQTVASKKNVTMHCRIEAQVTVPVPPSLVAITVSNLVRNALQHTASGEVEVRLEPERLTVRDTGEGIPPDVLEHIYDRHFSTSGSTGMGLYLAHRICERYGWHLHVSSTVGRGTTVVLGFQPA